MRLTIKIVAEKPIRLPLAYNHLIQGMIYSLISHCPEFSKSIHDEGVSLSHQKFKFFTFSQLYGQYTLEGKEIIFASPVYLEFGTIDYQLCHKLIEGILLADKIRLGNQQAMIESYCFSKENLNQTFYQIQMISPITVHSSYGKKTKFFSPLEKEFEEHLMINCRNKYGAFYGRELEEDFSIKPLDFSLKNKVVTTYKDYYITAWKGKYELRGSQEVLDFLYQVGLGEKNSLGFGMFKVIKKGI